MLFLLMLTSPLWPLLLLAAIDRLRVPLSRQRSARPHVTTVEFPDEDDNDTYEKLVKPPSFLITPANLPGIVSDRAMRSRQRARRMGMDTTSLGSF